MSVRGEVKHCVETARGALGETGGMSRATPQRQRREGHLREAAEDDLSEADGEGGLDVGEERAELGTRRVETSGGLLDDAVDLTQRTQRGEGRARMGERRMR